MRNMNEIEKIREQKKNKYDKDGWADVDLFKPLQWDLVQVQDDTGKRQAGWWTGAAWDFGRCHLRGRVVKWRKSHKVEDKHKEALGSPLFG